MPLQDGRRATGGFQAGGQAFLGVVKRGAAAFRKIRPVPLCARHDARAKARVRMRGLPCRSAEDAAESVRSALHGQLSNIHTHVPAGRLNRSWITEEDYDRQPSDKPRYPCPPQHALSRPSCVVSLKRGIEGLFEMTMVTARNAPRPQRRRACVFAPVSANAAVRGTGGGPALLLSLLQSVRGFPASCGMADRGAAGRRRTANSGRFSGILWKAPHCTVLVAPFLSDVVPGNGTVLRGGGHGKTGCHNRLACLFMYMPPRVWDRRRGGAG